jgi:hypothetical protein
MCLAACVRSLVGGSGGHDCRNCQTFAASSAEPGDLPWLLGRAKPIPVECGLCRDRFVSEGTRCQLLKAARDATGFRRNLGYVRRYHSVGQFKPPFAHLGGIAAAPVNISKERAPLQIHHLRRSESPVRVRLKAAASTIPAKNHQRVASTAWASPPSMRRSQSIIRCSGRYSWRRRMRPAGEA